MQNAKTSKHNTITYTVLRYQVLVLNLIGYKVKDDDTHSPNYPIISIVSTTPVFKKKMIMATAGKQAR